MATRIKFSSCPVNAVQLRLTVEVFTSAACRFRIGDGAGVVVLVDVVLELGGAGVVVVLVDVVVVVGVVVVLVDVVVTGGIKSAGCGGH